MFKSVKLPRVNRKVRFKTNLCLDWLLIFFKFLNFYFISNTVWSWETEVKWASGALIRAAYWTFTVAFCYRRNVRVRPPPNWNVKTTNMVGLGFGRGAFGEWWRLDEVLRLGPMIGFVSLKEEGERLELLLSLPVKARCGEGCLQARRRSSSGNGSAARYWAI